MTHRWKPEILASFHDRVTDTFSEGVTDKVKCIERAAFGYRNFERSRPGSGGVPTMDSPKHPRRAGHLH